MAGRRSPRQAGSCRNPASSCRRAARTSSQKRTAREKKSQQVTTLVWKVHSHSRKVWGGGGREGQGREAQRELGCSQAGSSPCEHGFKTNTTAGTHQDAPQREHEAVSLNWGLLRHARSRQGDEDGQGHPEGAVAAQGRGEEGAGRVGGRSMWVSAAQADAPRGQPARACLTPSLHRTHSAHASDASTHQQKATVPKVLRRWYSSRPAQNWARPPKKKPKETASCVVPVGSVSWVLAPCSSAVVSAKPYRPSGAGLAVAAGGGGERAAAAGERRATRKDGGGGAVPPGGATQR